MSKKNLPIMLCTLLLFSPSIFAQSNELSLSVGGIFTTNQTATTVTSIACPPTDPNCNVFTSAFKSSAGVAFMGNFARRVTALGPATFYLEAPVVGGPGRDGTVSFRNGMFLGDILTLTSSSLFFTPSAKVKFLDSSRVSPFATIGGGLAHLGLAAGNRNTGALQFGAGADFRSPVRRLGFRAEVRDFFSAGTLRSSTFTQVSPSHQHMVFAGGGVVFRF